MDSLVISRLHNADHVRCLQWFEDHEGEEIRFDGLTTDGIRLVTQFKGIYKPQWMPYALSIRTTEQDRYADGTVIRQDGGGWHLSYAQEDDSRYDPRTLYTNRGIQSCIDDGIPLGILRKERRQDPYEVVGLGLPIGWRDGFFTLVRYQAGSSPASSGRAEEDAEKLAWQEPETAPEGDYDARVRFLAEIFRRQGQPAFRAHLLAAYGGRCVISGCDVPDALEAAHIKAYRGPASNTVTNGLLLRADLHTLLDRRLLAIHPDTLAVKLSSTLSGTAYASFSGRRIAGPVDPAASPARELLDHAWGDFLDAESERRTLRQSMPAPGSSMP